MLIGRHHLDAALGDPSKVGTVDEILSQAQQLNGPLLVLDDEVLDGRLHFEDRGPTLFCKIKSKILNEQKKNTKTILPRDLFRRGGSIP